MANLHDRLRDSYNARQASLDPLIERFSRTLGMKVGLVTIMADLATQDPFQELMHDLAEQVIRPVAGKLWFSTAGHLEHLDGKTLERVQTLDCPYAAAVTLQQIRQHLEVSIAFLLRDIWFGKPTLFSLDWHRYGFTLPRIQSGKTDKPIKLLADLKTGLIHCPEHYFAASSYGSWYERLQHNGRSYS